MHIYAYISYQDMFSKWIFNLSMQEVLKDVLGYSIKSLFKEVVYMVSGYVVSFDTVHLAICNLCRITGV